MRASQAGPSVSEWRHGYVSDSEEDPGPSTTANTNEGQVAAEKFKEALVECRSKIDRLYRTEHAGRNLMRLLGNYKVLVAFEETLEKEDADFLRALHKLHPSVPNENDKSALAKIADMKGPEALTALLNGLSLKSVILLTIILLDIAAHITAMIFAYTADISGTEATKDCPAHKVPKYLKGLKGFILVRTAIGLLLQWVAAAVVLAILGNWPEDLQLFCFFYHLLKGIACCILRCCGIQFACKEPAVLNPGEVEISRIRDPPQTV